VSFHSDLARDLRTNLSTRRNKYYIFTEVFIRPFVSFYRASKLALIKLGHYRMKTGLLNIFTVACISTSYIGAVEAQSKYYKFDIPKNAVNITLGIIAKESETSLLLPYDKVKSIKANAIKGTYSLQKALSLALADTGLTASINNDGVIIVKVVDTTNKNFSIKPLAIEKTK